MFVQSLHLFRM